MSDDDDNTVHPEVIECGICKRVYVENTGSTICIECLAEALGFDLSE